MKKMLILMLCIGLIPALYANSDRAPQALPDTKAPYRTNFVMPEMPPTDQDTLWAQYPNPATAIGMACQRDTVYPFEAWLLDDVTPPSADADYVVEEVVSWWANWNGFTSWSFVPDIHFQVYEDSGLAYAFPKMMPSQEVIVLQANYTATTIGTDQYLVEMTLPSTVTLPAGEISWVCVQPSNVFTDNGQTGWMGEVGIGNGQECYFAFPLLGNDKWVTATSVFGDPNEAGFVLLGTEGGGGVEVTWDFEDGTWQDWVHTNGLAYPAGWDVIGSGTVNWPPPDMGSYCLALDDDAAGSGTSVIDTAISPVFTEFAGDWLYWGVGYNNIGSDWLDVIIAYGGTYDLVKHYTSDQGGYYYGVWDSVDVSGYGPGSYQIMFVYNDGGVWAWWAEIDNIGPVIMGAPDQHDVGSFAWLSPATQVTPADYDVIGVTKNYGGFEETYDVHCVVTDPTFAVVLDTTINVTTPMGENDTINFGTLTFVDGYTYDLMMATLLSGDEDPANDTLEQSTFVTSWLWESWAAIDQGRSGAYAGFWNIDGQSYVYYWGGNPGPLATGFKWDGSSWTAVASMPVGSSYGADMSYDGKVYLVSAWTGQNGMLSIFDCESETFASGTNLPTPVADPACALYQGNYLYSIGGSNPPGWAGSTIVQVYDIASDTWLTGVTQLPSGSYVTNGEAGYIGNDSLIVSGGYDAGATNKTTMGAINPANPAEVTWSTGTPHPGAAAYRNFGGAFHNDVGEYWFMVVGGSPYTDQAAIYQSNAGWITAPNKITACSNAGATAGPWETLTDDAQILLYTVGGYTGSYLNIFEVFYTGVWTGIQERPDDNVTVFDFSARTTNPVKDQVRFTLSMPYQGEVSFQVFDVTGRRIIDTRYSSISQGEHTLFWNLKDEQQREVAAGTYFYRFQAGEHTATGKLVVVR
jgi:hypothetical protein